MRIDKIAFFLTLTFAMVAFNLRTIAVAIGPVLPSLQEELGMSQTMAGLLTALPTLCFALFGFFAPPAALKWGLHRTVLVSLGLNVLGQTVRIMAAQTLAFMVGTVIALAGIGVINVLLPPLVKRHFPLRNGAVTAIYVTSQAIGLTLAGLYTAPLAISFGSWRGAFWVWAAAAATAVPLMVWATRRFQDSARTHQRAITLRDVAGTRLGWMMMIFFGTQSAQAYCQFGWLPTIYQSVGFTAVQSGNYLSILTGLGIPLSFIVPTLTFRLRRPTVLVVIMTVSGVTGYLGLLHDPAHLPWLWPALLALAGSSFPMILVLIGIHTRTTSGTAALSSFSQSMGYVLASLGPFMVGALYDFTGSFFWPLLIQLALYLPLFIAAMIVIRSGTLEDELGLPPEDALSATTA